MKGRNSFSSMEQIVICNLIAREFEQFPEMSKFKSDALYSVIIKMGISLDDLSYVREKIKNGEY